MNLATFLILSVIVILVILDIRYLLKNGISECSWDCGSCGPSCKWVGDIKKAQRRIRFKNKLKGIFGISK